MKIERILNERIGQYWALVDKTPGLGPQGNCWEWRGQIHTKHYGVFKKNRAHRISYLITFGDIPGNLWVLHRCDNRRCVNPAHLFLGTNVDNVNDCVAKGRKRSAETHQFAKLNDSVVRKARQAHARGENLTMIAKSLGVSPSALWQAATNKTWTHVV